MLLDLCLGEHSEQRAADVVSYMCTTPRRPYSSCFPLRLYSGSLTIIDGIPAVKLPQSQLTWADADKSAFQTLLSENDTYEVRVTVASEETPSLPPAQASIFLPACALTASSFREALSINLPKPSAGFVPLPSDMLAGLTYETPTHISTRSTRCQNEAKHASQIMFKPVTVSTSVTVAKPSQPPVPNRGPSMADINNMRAGVPVKAQTKKSDSGAAEGVDGDNKAEKAAEEEEKGFLAKYWMYIVPFVIAVVMGGGGDQQQQEGKPQNQGQQSENRQDGQPRSGAVSGRVGGASAGKNKQS